MIRALLAIFALLICSPAWAQSLPSGSQNGMACQYNGILPSLGSGTGHLAQCDSSSILFSDVNHVASGAAVDGWNVTAGAKADTVCATATGTCSEIALLKFIGSSVSGSIPAGSAAIGTVNPSTAANWGIGATGSSVPANGFYNSLNVSGNLRGWTGVNPTGSVYAGQMDLSSVGGTSVALGSTTASASIPVVIASNQTAADPCMFQAKTNVAIATSSGNTQLVAPSSGKKVYICYAKIVGASAWVGSLIEGTGGACTTANEAAISGSTTAANGESYAANGGFVAGNGSGEVGLTATASNGVCLLQSGTVALAGNITFVQQ